MPAEWTPPDFAIADLELPRKLPVSLPSVLVRQRPDILAAEANLHADSAAIGVATAEMYPQITLSASIVGQAAAIADLFRTASRIAAADADLDAPLARGGALAAQRRAAIDAYEAQVEIYRQTVLVAFGQVADVLSSIANDNALVAASRQSVSIAQASVQLQRSSYAAGRTSALQLIVAQDVYSQARLGSVRAEGQRLQDTAQLFVALGGGWWNREDLASPAR
jgi:NodT family efflux transporter outer membrane factor (OMF) lipoprotein